MSDGKPTALVRDNDAESRDEPPGSHPFPVFNDWALVASRPSPAPGSAARALTWWGNYAPVVILAAVAGQFVIWDLALHALLWALAS
jgi:hypothetical protein